MVTSRKNMRGGHFVVNTESIWFSHKWADRCGATPDGRRKGDLLSKNLSASIGQDRRGITAHILSVTKFDATKAAYDGPGIRTTVFFSGCPLRCKWCHNPEGLLKKPQLGYLAQKCFGCRKCTLECPNKVHEFTSEGQHLLHREKCTVCGKCVDSCPAGALLRYGKPMSVNEVMTAVLEDRDFYDCSADGVTLSGGECTMQPEFCIALLKQLKENGIHTAVDTCGFIPREVLKELDSVHRFVPLRYEGIR